MKINNEKKGNICVILMCGKDRGGVFMKYGEYSETISTRNGYVK